MASEKHTLMNTVSKIISRALSLQNFSSYETKLNKNLTLIQSYLAHIVYKFGETVPSGSSADGINVVGSDFDEMSVLPYLTVHTALTDMESVRGNIVLWDTNGSRPGFGRLRLVHQDDTTHLAANLIADIVQETLQDTNQGKYLSSDKFLKFFISIVKSIDANDPSVANFQHGPCILSKPEEMYLFDLPTKTSADMAVALECGQCPVEAKEWVTRERLHNWPPQEVVDKIIHQKCHVVPVGDPRSSFVSLEWRLSFLLWEQELVWNFNDTQVQCLVLLKMLLKTYIEPLAPDQLSSYHMKMIIFWMSEEKGLSVWHDENLLQCVVDSLSMLKSCIVKAELQHYFYRQRNLLTYKLEDVSEKERVLLKIDEMQEDIVTHALKCMPESKLLEQWIFLNGNVTKFIEAIKRIPDYYDDYTRKIKFLNVKRLYSVLFTIFECTCLEILHPFQVVWQLKEWEEHHPKNVMLEFQNMTKLFLDLRVGMTYFKHTIVHEDKDFKDIIQTMSLTVDDPVQLVKRALDIDSMSGALYLATVYLWQGKISASTEIVFSVLRQNKNLMYLGSCSSNTIIQLTLEGKVRQGSNIYLCGKEGRTHLAYDVLFSSQDLHLVPYPVQFECAVTKHRRASAVMIHPCVYAYCLLCIGQYYVRDDPLFQDFLSQLQEIVCETVGGHQRYRSLNILGICYYYLDRNLKEAFRCFRESLKETRDFPLLLNAAVYHIGILIVDFLEEKEKEDMLNMRK